MNYLVWGPPGTTKSTFAMSGEGKKWYVELDPGSLERAKRKVDMSLVEVYECYPPFSMDEGVLDVSMVGNSGKGAVQIVHQLEGYDEAHKLLRGNFAKAILNPEIDSIIFDTGTLLDNLIVTSFLQRIQNETDVERTRLTKLEYKERAAGWFFFLNNAKAKKKNIIITAREREMYKGGEPTGVMIPSGWDDAPYQVDMEIRFSIENRQPVGTIMKAGGAHVALVGVKVIEPTIPKMEELTRCAWAISDQKLPMPESAESIIEQGQALGAR